MGIKDKIIKLENVSWRDIQDLQPDELKTIYNYEHLKKSLLNNGFANPLFVWEDDGVLWSVDGKTRREVLMDISNDMEVPEKLPAIFIKAKDRKEAIKILLEVFNAKENPSNQEVLIEWLEVENIDIQEVNIESINVVSENIEEEETEQKDLSSNIKNLFRIEIVCKDEEHQENSYNKLIEQGYECRLLTL
jgi:hypothetical protein